jgi:parvulin-like peptidyl-prolyl isomerase
MKYLYYIAGILVVFSALAVYGLLDTRVEISKPVIVVNDRIITELDFQALLPSKPYYMTEDQYMESIITQQLLVQEAVRQDINKEESFRKSVEKYYEQSLIKILLDRTLSSLEVTVSEEEIKRYQSFSQSKVYISKLRYPTLADALDKKDPVLQKIASGFMNISDDLKFIVFNLEKGQSSAPFVTNAGVIVYQLDDIKPMETGKVRELDMEKISLFIRDKKKEVLMDEWSKKLKENAEIWRQK